MELDEGMLQLGLRAAAWRVSFLPCRAGLGSAIMEVNPELRTVVSPYDGEELVAMPALRLDVALLHANRADERGDAQYLGPDWYFDDLFAMAADRTFVSCERVVAPGDFAREGPLESIRVSRIFTDGVVEAPFGAHFTHCVPDYDRDERFQREYAASAKDPRRGPPSAPRTSICPRPSTARSPSARCPGRRHDGRLARRRVCRRLCGGVARRRRDPGQPDRRDPHTRGAPRRADLRA
jgi:hypothetical protein